MISWKSHLSAHAWPASLPVPKPEQANGGWEGGVCDLFPGIDQRLAATPQDAIYHAEGDVWTHTKMVVDCLLRNPEYAKLDDANRGVLFYAAVLHDISKPETTREESGRVIAPGHSARGAIEARRLLWELSVPFPLREQVCRLIEVHQVPFFAFSSRKGVSVEFLARKISCDRSIELLCLLATADMGGRICSDQQKVLDEISLFRHQAKELGCLDRRYPFPDAATRMAYLRSEGSRYPDEPVFVQDPYEVTLMSGLPASGKNTWVANNSHLPVVSYDDIRDDMGFKHGQGVGTIVHAATDKMKEHLRKREPFIINATHLSRQMRGRAIDLINNYGGQVRVVYCEATPDDVLSRNSNRNTTLPNSKLMKMTSRWEVPGLDEVDFLDLNIQTPKMRKGYSAGRGG